LKGRGTASRGAFVEIPRAFLREIATDSERIPRMYTEGNVVSRKVFWMRLRRIHRLLGELGGSRQSCLDFGAGGGVFLPSLAGAFERVVALDLETAEAEQVVARYGLGNVVLRREDVTRAEPPEAPFDVVVAADVLEHFRELAPPIEALRRLLRREGLLLTSLPTETGLYDGLRRLHGIERPPDHYHTGFEVEDFLTRNGFRRVRRSLVPLGPPLLSLYLVSAWRLTPDRSP
jgi:SAM-dependent methyltransferase